MSAAAPLPPPGPPPGHAIMNSRGADGYRGSDGAGDGRAPAPSHPPMSEIVASAKEKVNEFKHYPIKRLLDNSKNFLLQAKLAADNRGGKPAAAYWSYLVAYMLAVDAIAHHPDYYEKIDQSRSQLQREWKDLMRELTECEPRFLNIKATIITDNKRNGIYAQPASRPVSIGSNYTTRTATPGSNSPRLSNSFISRRDDELMLPSVPSNAPIGGPPHVDSSRRKPLIQPKPQNLHGRSLHQSTPSMNGSGGTNDLADRFAKLRGAAAPLNTVNGSPGPDLSVKMPSPTEYQSFARPGGPRDMPPPPNYPIPQHPPRMHLNTQLATSMPKEPSPTYSPARNLSMPASINPPRSTARSMVGTGGRSNSIQASSLSSYAPNSNGETDSYFPTQPKVQEIPAPRRASTQKAIELQITAERLYDYLRMYDVLIVDVRSREEFDGGHIFVRNIMCVEPATLRDGFSAEQLHDRLILSPDEEQTMYERRNEYEVVVYYDECTKNNSFLSKHNPTDKELALKRLYDTLYEFNAEKPLKRPPIFLMGGIDAWIDIVGTPALKMSSTAAIVTNGQSGPGRGIRRVPVATYNPRINLPKRRTREYTSMDPEEEQRWLEEARKGRAVLESPEGDDFEPTSPVYRTTEEFLRRYPDVEVEQQSMRYPPSRPPPPNQYSAPPIPPAPSRPAPSVPRMSYSGVHERQAAPQGRPAQLPVYVSPGRYGQIGLHKTGLINFGVTCYMNSVLQCLSANTGLTDIFLSDRYQRDLQRDNWKGSKGILPEAYATLISNMYKGDVNNLRPTTFRRVCGHFGRQWGIDQQQDAKEFLEFLLDMLHEDHNVAWNKAPLRTLTEADELVRESLPRTYAARLEWNRYQHRDMSLIGSLFAGQHASQLTCQTCGFTSTTYEAFWSISVEIPHDRPADLRDCLRSYCSSERLSGDEVWRCTRCKKEREATKKITITRAPDTLVVHFKRFSASRTQSARKIRTPIHFPLTGLDLGPFVEPPITPEQEAYVMGHAQDSTAQLVGLKTDPAMNGPYIYNAYAVIWHIGQTLGSGHYIAMVRDKSRGCWRQFNDDKIIDFSPEKLSFENRLQNEKAYIIFYEREKNPGAMF